MRSIEEIKKDIQLVEELFRLESIESTTELVTSFWRLTKRLRSKENL